MSTPEEGMGPEEPLGTVAARGVGVLVARTVALQLLTAGVTVALAHILDPADYGIFAIALAAQMLGLRFSELGIAAALLRRPEEPSDTEQRALLTVFLSLGLGVCTLAFVLAFALLPWSGLEEEGAQVVAVCLLAIPIYACRSVPIMLLERRLSYGRVALVETGETLAFNAFALLAALAGLGAFSLAGAIPVAALVGTAIAWRLQPFARGLTRRLSPVRPLIRFGLGLTSLQIVNLGGALAFVSALTAAGGASLAGFYALAQRLFAFPTALTSALLRVSFPALSRGEAAERARRAGRAAVLGAVVVGLPLALVVGAADPLIEVLFGEEWLPVADLVVLGAVAMMLITAAAVPMTSLSLADGYPAPPVWATLLQFVVLVGGALVVTGLGTMGVGALMAAGAVVNVALLATRTAPAVRRALLTVLLALAIGAVAAGAGQALDAGGDITGLAATVALTAVVWLALTAVFMREPATAVWRLARPYLGRRRPLLPVLVIAGIAAAAALALSGGEERGPRTPEGIAGRAEPFLGVALLGGGGGLGGAVDAYGTIVDLRFPGPAEESQIAIPHRRQEAGTVTPRTGLALSFADSDGEPRPVWEADAVRQSYRTATNVLRTRARRGSSVLQVEDAAAGALIARRLALTGEGVLRLRMTADLDLGNSPGGDTLHATAGGFKVQDGSRSALCSAEPPPHVRIDREPDPLALLNWRGSGRLEVALTCGFGVGLRNVDAFIAAAAEADRRWLRVSRRLGAEAPGWARAMHGRSLLVLRSLTDPRTGAMAAGLREAWAYVWPRDAASAALALAAAGHRREARDIAHFLSSLDLAAGARFLGNGSVVPDGRPAQGDAGGWTRLAREAAGLPAMAAAGPGWRGRPDYGERSGDEGDYIANAIVAGVGQRRLRTLFRGDRGLLVRRAGAPTSELDSATAWAVAPFPRPGLRAPVAATLDAVARTAGPFGLEPHTRWPGRDPWTAPTAWTALGQAALGRRGAALALLARLRRAATDTGLLPERVDPRTGVPVSTTPLGWSHAFTVLTLHRLWPPVRSP